MTQRGAPPTTVSSAPPALSDGPLRLYGPDVGEHFAQHAPLSSDAPRTSISTKTLTQWIDRSPDSQVSSLDLYVHLHRLAAKLNTFETEVQQEISSLAQPVLALDRNTSAALQLSSPSHILSITCDCVAPRARLELYLINTHSITQIPVPPRNTSQGAPHPHGWRMASADVVNGLEMHVSLPLMLKTDWVSSLESPSVQLALTIEALDEVGQVLIEPNAQTMYFTAECDVEKSSWRLLNGSQTVYINGYAMQLHQLFGMTAHQDGPTSNEMEAQAAPAAAISDAGLENDATECPICMTLEPTTVLLPCTHALCLECASRVRESVEKSRNHDRNNGRAPRLRYACPICRATIQSMLALSR
ncbi:hypothetical protein MYAM1_002027 [Malassezia yamatoensis]|uniref:RING-type domain-containing protein n=1 Tax=Malassezia yamatoensis TaxID=253288 RepID=A0AAJ6CHY2_9BASI|nr:hypothetical protein MYAM1_002027 [Malassezia yamatoensis]